MIQAKSPESFPGYSLGYPGDAIIPVELESKGTVKKKLNHLGTISIFYNIEVTEYCGREAYNL